MPVSELAIGGDEGRIVVVAPVEWKYWRRLAKALLLVCTDSQPSDAALIATQTPN